MVVNISFGEKPPTPEQEFLTALDKWMNEEHQKVKAAEVELHQLKAAGTGGMSLWNAMSANHGPYASIQSIKMFHRICDKMSQLSIKHKPEFKSAWKKP
jgi:hypothetical protein